MNTLQKFQQQFPDNEACYQYLYNKKWSTGFCCPKCGCTKAFTVYTRRLLQCKGCKFQESVTSGTIFHKMRLPLLKTFWAAYWISTCKKGISAKELQRQLEISYQTAWHLLHKFRTAMKSTGKYPITESVELDEACLGYPEDKLNKDQHASARARIKTVVEAGDDYIGRIYFEHIQSGHASKVKGFMFKNVRKGVTVKTDGATNLKFLKTSYNHLPHKMYDKKDNQKHLPKVHTIIGNLKMWLRGTHNSMPYKNAQLYLNEFCFRFNRRNRIESIFDTLLHKEVNNQTVTYAELTG